MQIIKNNGFPLWSKSVFMRPYGVDIKDIDGDGKGEVFVHGRRYWDVGHFYVFDHMGKLLWEFDGRNCFCWVSFINLDNDSELEIFLSGGGWGRYTGYALYTDGSLLWSFTAPSWLSARPAIADVNGDGKDEIVQATYRDVYVLDRNGNVLTKIPNPYGSRIVDKFVSSGDITGDGLPDIVFGVRGSDVNDINALHAYRNDGTPL